MSLNTSRIAFTFRRTSVSVKCLRSFKSAPALNALLPAPVNMATLTSGSIEISSVTACKHLRVS